MDNTSIDVWAQGIRDFIASIESDQSRWQRFYWAIYSGSYSIARVMALPVIAIGYAIVDAIKDACEEFSNSNE